MKGRVGLFGYIKPFTPELKMKEHEAFRGVYCGLCHQLGQSFGVLARLTLNYDFVFLAMLYYATQEEQPEICKGRCSVNPFQKVPVCQSDGGMIYTADIAALMIYYKVLDNVEDDTGVKRIGWKMTERLLQNKWKQAAERQPKANEIIKEMMKEQWQVEEKNLASIDASCEPTAKALSRLMGELGKDTKEQQQLERLGYLVGRYIYLCDAVEDVEKDLKTRNYNPLIRCYLPEHPSKEEIEQAREEGKSSIFMTIGELGALSQNLPFAYFAPIIHNIIQYGMRSSVQELLKRKGGTRSEGSV